MPKMPINVGKLLEAAKSIGSERELPVSVDIVFDATAGDALVNMLLDAFVEADTDAVVNTVVLASALPDIPVPADLCVIAGGDSVLLGDVASSARAKGIPTVVAVSRGDTFFSKDASGMCRPSVACAAEDDVTGGPAAESQGKGISLDDIIDIDTASRTARPLEELGRWIVENAPAKRLAMAADFPFLRHPLACELSRQSAVQNGAIGLVFFIPGADMPLITLNQAKMVLQIAVVYGYPLDKERIADIVAVLAGAFGCRALARKLTSLVPVMGWAIKPAVAVSGTVAMGHVAIDRFEGDGAVEELADALEDVLGKAANAVDDATGAVGNAVDRVRAAAD